MKTALKKLLGLPYVMLMIVAVIMSFAIAGVHALTKDTIEAAALEAQAAARSAVMVDAAAMAEISLEEGSPLDYCFEAYDEAGNVIGYVGQITVVGFGGEIEVTVGMDVTGSITAISVGGSDFSETSGLGAKTREPAFTEQFRGMSGLLVLKQNIDSVTGASISSGAVVSGVNKALEYMKSLLPEGAVSANAEELPLMEEQIEELLPGAENVVWMGGGSGIDGWWQADNGYIVRATGFGEGPIAVTMGFDPSGSVTGIIIGDENFMETEGRGDRVLEDWYKAQFLGKSGAQAYGEGVDAIAGATVTSDATLSAINACMSFDPASGAAAVPAEAPAPDASTEASVPAEETTSEPAVPGETPPPAPITDAVTKASVPAEETEAVAPTPPPAPVPDAVTEASEHEEEMEAVLPTPSPTPDAVTEASVPEEEAPTQSTSAPLRVEVLPHTDETPEPDAVTEASVED